MTSTQPSLGYHTSSSKPRTVASGSTWPEGLCEDVGWEGEGSRCAQVLTSVFLWITKATKQISAERRVLF